MTITKQAAKFSRGNIRTNKVVLTSVCGELTDGKQMTPCSREAGLLTMVWATVIHKVEHQAIVRSVSNLPRPM